MPILSASRSNFLTSATCNWGLWADTAGDAGTILRINWGGEASATQAMRTRWCRPSTVATASTALTVGQSGSARAVTSLCSFVVLTTALVLPTNVDECLHQTSWNAFGGLGGYSMDDQEAWDILQAATGFTQIICAQTAGIAVAAPVMSAGCVWRE
jgi:hypothetical protein